MFFLRERGFSDDVEVVGSAREGVGDGVDFSLPVDDLEFEAGDLLVPTSSSSGS